MKKRNPGKRIKFPQGISAGDRRWCRDIYNRFTRVIKPSDIVVACSGGMDSTVLAHMLSTTRSINKLTFKRFTFGIAHINHQLRPPEETLADEAFIAQLAQELNCDMCIKRVVVVTKGKGIQAAAREARYRALNKIVSERFVVDRDYHDPLEPAPQIMLAHTIDDLIETRLFQFITGRALMQSTSLTSSYPLGMCVFPRIIALNRPFFQLNITRADVERYAAIWNLKWVEDSTNAHDDYTRNRIRHHLIPWIRENVNPGVLKTLSRNM